MAKIEKDTSPKGDYRVKSSLHHDGELYEEGETVTLTEKQAARLAAGVVEPVNAPKEKPAA